MTVYLVGEAPPPGADLPHKPFRGKSGQVLSELCGFKVSEVFETCNLLPYIPEVNPVGGMRFPLKEGKKYAREFLKKLDPKDNFIIVGVRCTRAFRMRHGVEPCSWTTISLGTTLTIGLDIESIVFGWIPHPSGGYNRWYKNSQNARSVRRFLRGDRE